MCKAPNGDPRLAGSPPGSTLHVVRLEGKETYTVLTGYVHLVIPNADAKESRMVTGACGTKGLPYVWKGVGTRVTSVANGVTCPRCQVTERYRLKLGQVDT